MKVRSHYHLARIALIKIENIIPRKFSKTSFFIGTILADCCLLPLTKPHYYSISSSYVYDELYKLSKNNSFNIINSIKLGILVHYLCDFCCNSHINNCIGNPHNHMLYERQIQKYLLKNLSYFENKSYNSYTSSNYSYLYPIYSTNELVDFINSKIENYKKGIPSYKWDITNSISITQNVCTTLFKVLQKNNNDINLLKNASNNSIHPNKKALTCL